MLKINTKQGNITSACPNNCIIKTSTTTDYHIRTLELNNQLKSYLILTDSSVSNTLQLDNYEKVKYNITISEFNNHKIPQITKVFIYKDSNLKELDKIQKEDIIYSLNEVLNSYSINFNFSLVITFEESTSELKSKLDYYCTKAETTNSLIQHLIKDSEHGRIYYDKTICKIKNEGTK